MNNSYKTELENVKFNMRNIVNEDYDDNANIQKFNEFCKIIFKFFKENNKILLTKSFDDFRDFLNHFPSDFFEDFSLLIENDFLNLVIDCIQPVQNFSICFNCISLVSTICYSCKGIAQYFSNNNFLSLVCNHIMNDKDDMQCEFIQTLSNILLDSPIEIHSQILDLLPFSKFLMIYNGNQSSQNSNSNKFIQSCLAFLSALTQFKITSHLTSQDITSIISISNDNLLYFPTYCFGIYFNLINKYNILTGYNILQIQNFLKSNNEEYIYNSCFFISIIYAKTQESELDPLLDFERLLNIGLTDQGFCEKTKEVSLYAVRTILENNNQTCNLINMDLIFSKFTHCSRNQKITLGYIICQYTKNVQIQNVAIILEGQTNFFMVARELFETGSKDLTIQVFQALIAIFKLGEKRQNLYDRCITLFFEAFPENTIWDYVNADDKDVEEIGNYFAHSVFSIDDE